MSSVRVDVTPRALEWARARSGIDTARWEKRFPDYDLWLRGEARPTYKQLQEFARKTHAPFGFLLLAEPPIEAMPIADFRTIGDRQIGGRPSANLLDVIYACERRQEWYRDDQLFEGEPPLDFVGSASLAEPVGDVANRMQQLLGWTADARLKCSSTDAALTSLRERAERVNALVMISGIVGSDTTRKLNPAEFRGFALADPHASIVFVNGADAKAAQVFTLVHELAHLWLGETGVSDLGGESVRSNGTERWCNEVAVEFLVPMVEFRSRFDAGSPWRDQVQSLAKHFRVSGAVILGRLREAGVLTWDQYSAELRATTFDQPSSAVGTSGGDFYNTKPVQVSRRFASAVIASAKEGRTPYMRAFRLLDLKKSSTFDGLAERLGIV